MPQIQDCPTMKDRFNSIWVELNLGLVLAYIKSIVFNTNSELFKLIYNIIKRLSIREKILSKWWTMSLTK